MTNQNDNPADERARRIAEAKARAEAAKQARAGGGTPPTSASVPAQPSAAATPVPAEAPEVVAASAAPAASAEDERARRIAEARARAEAAKSGRAGGATPTPAATPAQPTAEAAAPPVAAASTAPPAGEAAGASSDDRAARIAAARARAQQAATAKGGGAAPAPPPAAAAAPASGSTFAVTPAPTAPAASTPVPAPAAARPAAAPAVAPAAAAAPAVARTLPAGTEEWRAPRNAGSRMVTARPDPGALAARELSRQEVQNLVTRRSMIRTSFWAGLGVTMAGLLLGFVNFFWPRKVTGFGSLVTVPATVVPQPGADPVRIPEAKAWLINLKPGEGVPEQFAGTAPASKEGGLLALYQKCVHLGCTVPWRPEFDFEGVKGWFRCPCHGSTYTKGGVRVFGPAPRSLDTFLLKANSDGSVIIDTRAQSIKLGGLDDPQRAIKLG